MVRALTNRNSEGELYVRPQKVEQAIQNATKQSLAQIKKRAAVLDKKSAAFLPSECIVHLIRKANRENDTRTVNVLFPVLLSRCERNLKSAVLESLPNAIDVREEILFKLCDLFAKDSIGENIEELDYYECKFNRAFRSIRIMAVRKHSAQKRGGTSKIETLPDLSTDQSSNKDADILFSKLTDLANQEDRVFLSQVRKVIQDMPPDEQRALILCHVLGYKIESIDPKERTAASICEVTGKTIRNRLAKAKEKLMHLHKEL